MRLWLNIVIPFWGCFVSSRALARTFDATCRVADGTAVARIETEDSGLRVNGPIVMTYRDKFGNELGNIRREYVKTIGENSSVVVMREPVDWYVESCQLDLGEADIEVRDRTVMRRQEVIVERVVRPAVTVEPRVVIGFPLPPLFPPVTTVVHTHGPHCSHWEQSDVGSWSTHQSRTVIRTHQSSDWPASRQSIEIHSNGAGRRAPDHRSFGSRPNANRVVTINHRS